MMRNTDNTFELKSFGLLLNKTMCLMIANYGETIKMFKKHAPPKKTSSAL